MKDKTMKNTFPILNTNITAMLARVCILIIATVLLAGCGSKMSGIYKTDSSFAFKQLNFTSGSKVELTSLAGSISEATYVVDGDKVKISAGGSTHIFTKDSTGCLDGGGAIGKFCKE